MVYVFERCWWHSVRVIALKRCWWHCVRVTVFPKCWWHGVRVIASEKCWWHSAGIIVLIVELLPHRVSGTMRFSKRLWWHMVYVSQYYSIMV